MVRVKKTQMDLMKNMEMKNEDVLEYASVKASDGAHIDEDGNLNGFN